MTTKLFTQALLFLPGRRAVEANPTNGKQFTLEEAQKSVGFKSNHKGAVYVEAIRLPHDILVLVDEDGISKGLEFNADASALVGRRIVGNALLVPPGQF